MFIKKVIKTFITLFLILLIVEFGFRTWDVYSDRIVTNRLWQLLYKDKASSHPFLQYTSKNNFEGLLSFLEPGQRFYVSTNAYGFHTKEFYPKLPGFYRVLILGDSFMYGYNASQEHTVAVQLEELIRKNIYSKIEVFSLGVASYSGVRYSVLVDLYLNFLKPDIVIVAIDQSDFEEDLQRISDYNLHADGAPYYLKNADAMISNQNRRNRITAHGKFESINVRKTDLELRLQIGFSLYARLKGLIHKIASNKLDNLQEITNNASIITYESLVAKYGTDLSKHNIGRLAVDTIMYDYETALERYQATLVCMKHVARICKRNNTTLFIASYPYPWMVSIREAIPYQYYAFNGRIYDFRNNRVHPRILRTFAQELNIAYINTYPAFMKSKEKNYGNYDPHFNKNGYRLFAETVYQAIADDIKQDIAVGTEM